MLKTKKLVKVSSVGVQGAIALCTPTLRFFETFWPCFLRFGAKKKGRKTLFYKEFWPSLFVGKSMRQDLNLRPLRPERSALPS